jgi:hypothetical protein
MNPFRWLETKLFTGEVVKDYGVLYHAERFTGRETHTLLLCRKAGQLWIVIRHSYRLAWGFRVSYTKLPAAMAESLGEKFAHLARDRNEARPY